MDFRHLIVTCLFSMLRLSFEAQKIKENYAILRFKCPDCWHNSPAFAKVARISGILLCWNGCPNRNSYIS